MFTSSNNEKAIMKNIVSICNWLIFKNPIRVNIPPILFQYIFGQIEVQTEDKIVSLIIRPVKF